MALLLVFAMAASIAVMLYMQLPRAAFEAQRQREQTLIDRGEQYTRAIQLYVAKNRRYPASIDDLEKTGTTRFLRKRYRDPMTGEDEWRVIHVDAAGRLTDSIIHKTEEKKDQYQNTFISEGPTIGSTGAPPGAGGANLALRRRPSDNLPAGLGEAQMQPGGEMIAGQPGAAPGGQPYPQPGQVMQGQIPLQGQPYPGQPGMQPQPGQPQPGQPQPGQPQPGQMYPGQQQYPGQQYPGQPYPGQPNSPQTVYPGQPNPGQPYPGQPQPGQPYPGQPQPGQPYPGQPYPGQPPYPVQPGQGGGFPAQPGAQPQPGFPGQPGQPGFQQPGTMPQGFPGQTYPTNPAQQQGRPTPGYIAGPQAMPDNPALRAVMGQIYGPRPQGSPQPTTTAPGGQQIGGGIAGVASKLEADSIKIYNERQKYNEWEFIYDFSKDRKRGGAIGQTPGQPRANQPGAQPVTNPPSGPQPFGPSGPNAPFQPQPVKP